MRRLSDLTGTDLIWHQTPALGREYELRTEEGETVAALHWVKAVGTLAAGETATGAWTFKRTGALVPRVTVRRQGSDDDIISFRPRFAMLGPTVLVDAERYRWAADFLASEWRFLSPSGAPLMKLERRPSMRLEGVLRIDPAAAELGHLDPYALVGWYLFVLLADEIQDAAVLDAP